MPKPNFGDRKLGLIKYVMALMNGARLGIMAQAVGLSEAAYREGYAYALDRKQFGKAIIQFPAIYEMLSLMRAKADASRAMLYETARFVDMYKALDDISKERKLTPEERQEMKKYSKLADAFTPMGKGMTTEFANQNAYDAIQIHGGSGFMKDYTCERLYRDARITNIYEGTTQLQVVAAIRHVTTGTYLNQLHEYDKIEYKDDLKPLQTRLQAMTAKYAELVEKILANPQSTDVEIDDQRANVKALREKLATIDSEEAKHLNELADYLIKKSVWILGGDGWAYDIGFGGLDHAIASGKNINILVMDTGVYSNTGGQQSKATPMGASAKFATAGKALPKKDLGMIAMSYGNVYVAQISVGANDMQTIKALNEAEAYDGPSLIIAYSHCIAQGFNLADGLEHQKNAVETGSWPLYRYNPENVSAGKAPLMLDSKAPSKPLSDYMSNETRFQVVNKMNPERYETLLNKAQENVKEKRSLLEHMAEYKVEEDTSAAE